MHEFKIPLAGVPHLPVLDATRLLLREGYPFIYERRRALGSDAFTARVLGRRALFFGGPAAAELFYDESRMQRAGAVPITIKRSLFGAGGVQELDDDAHKERKALFMSLMTEVRLETLLEFTAEAWSEALLRGPQRRVVIFDQASRVFCRSVCAWLGIPLSVEHHVQLTDNCVRMVDGFASAGIRLVRAIRARSEAERWAQSVIDEVRNGSVKVSADSPVAKLAHFRTAKGELLPTQIAAVELLNLIRPTVAIAWWVAFAAKALHEHPAYLARLRQEVEFSEPFVQEIRRFYPFTPYLGAKTRVPFEWRGIEFKQGQLVLLDVYGSLRDPRQWGAPETFNPERFMYRSPGKFDFIPNGGGEFTGHRCAGEWIVKECLKQAVVVLSHNVTYRVPHQDLDYSLSRMPTRPRSGVIFEDIRPLHVPRFVTEPVSDPYSSLTHSAL